MSQVDDFGSLILLFQHHALRIGARQSHPELRSLISATDPIRRMDIFTYFWARATMLKNRGLPRGAQPHVKGVFEYCGGISCEKTQIAGFDTTLLLFPLPTRQTEAYFAAILEPSNHTPAYPDESNLIKYFTLERASQDVAMFCEWRGTKHCSYGAIEPKSLNIVDFCDRISRQLGGTVV